MNVKIIFYRMLAVFPSKYKEKENYFERGPGGIRRVQLYIPRARVKQ